MSRLCATPSTPLQAAQIARIPRTIARKSASEQCSPQRMPSVERGVAPAPRKPLHVRRAIVRMLSIATDRWILSDSVHPRQTRPTQPSLHRHALLDCHGLLKHAPCRANARGAACLRVPTVESDIDLPAPSPAHRGAWSFWTGSAFTTGVLSCPIKLSSPPPSARPTAWCSRPWRLAPGPTR